MRKSKFGTKEIKILGLSHRGTLEFYDFIIFVFLHIYKFFPKLVILALILMEFAAGYLDVL